MRRGGRYLLLLGWCVLVYWPLRIAARVFEEYGSVTIKPHTERVRQRIETNSQNLADGLERFQRDLLEMFNSQLDAFRSESLARDEERIAMITSLVLEIGALKSGITGLSQQFAELLAALERPQDGD